MSNNRTYRPEFRVPTEDVLQAYVDNLLGEKDRVWVEAYLARNPEEAKRVRDFRAQNRALKALFEGENLPPLPAETLSSAKEFRSILVMADTRQRWMSGMAAAAAVVLGIGMLWAVNAFHSADQVQPLAAIEPENTAILPISASTDTGLTVGGDQPRTSSPLPLPDLAAMGFALTDSRLYSTQQGLAAHLLYEDGKKRPLALCITGAGPVQASNLAAERTGALTVASWQDERIHFSMAGAFSANELRQISQYTASQTGSGSTNISVGEQVAIPGVCREMVDWLPAAVLQGPPPDIQIIDLSTKDALENDSPYR